MNTFAMRVFVTCGLLVGCLFAVPSAALGLGQFGSSVVQTGSEQTVFDYSTDHCAGFPYHFADSHPRAIRAGNPQQVQLILSNAGVQGYPSNTRRMIGSSLDTVVVERDANGNCPVIHSTTNYHSSSFQESAATYDNWEWLASPYTEDGNRVEALVTNEFHGSEFTGGCPNGQSFTDCWYTSITHARSSNGGATYPFHWDPRPNHLVASIPYPYDPDPDVHSTNTDAQGYFAPSNIVKKDNAYYAIMRVQAPYGAQKGNGPYAASCLIRSTDLFGPPANRATWRGYDGNPNIDQGFTRTFVAGDPPPADPENHVCEPISPSKIGAMSANLTYNTFFDRWMLVDNFAKNGVVGFYYSLSRDLVNWSDPQLLVQTEWRRTFPNCEVGLPSVIDPRSTDRNFTTVGQSAYIYFVRFNPNCEGSTLDRDLVRVPIRFKHGKRTATGLFFTCPGGTDAGYIGQFGGNPGGVAYTPPASGFGSTNDRAYDEVSPAPKFAYQAFTHPGGATAFGVFNKQGESPACFSDENERMNFSFTDGSEALYGGAFFLPRTGFWDKMDQAFTAHPTTPPSVTLMRLGTKQNAGKWAGNLSVDKGGLLKFTANDGTGDRVIMSGLPIPTDPHHQDNPNDPDDMLPGRDSCWHRIDVFQQFGLAFDKYTGVWVDGVLVGITAWPVLTAASPPNDVLGAGIVAKQNVEDLNLYLDQLWMDPDARPTVNSRCE